MEPDREIPQRELRNNVGGVLRDVAAGARIRVTVRGKPVAELVPVRGRRTFVSRGDLEAMLGRASLDAGFAVDVDAALGETVEEL